jgi:4-hydroxybenzoate polyprenyltransferase
MKQLVFAWFNLIRWKNLTIILLMALFCRHFLFGTVYHASGIGQPVNGLTFSILLVSLILLGAGGYIINAVLDRRIDLVNKPSEVIIGKQIDAHTAVKVYYGLTAIAIVLGGLAAFLIGSFKLAGLHVIAAGLFWSYSHRYKQIFLVGNLLVSLLSAMLIPVLWIFDFFALRNQDVLFGAMIPQLDFVNRLVIMLFMFAFLLSLVREIIKDVEDMEGDQRYGCQSLPLKIGVKNTNLVILLINLIIALASWFWIPRTSGSLFLFNNLYIIAFIIIPLIFTSLFLLTRHDQRSFMIASRIFKFSMVSGILSFLFSIIH